MTVVGKDIVGTDMVEKGCAGRDDLVVESEFCPDDTLVFPADPVGLPANASLPMA
jgi:hypothetical protein